METNRIDKKASRGKLLLIAFIIVFAIIAIFKALLLYVAFPIYNDPVLIALDGKARIENIDIDWQGNMSIVSSASFPDGVTQEQYQQVYHQIYG